MAAASSAWRSSVTVKLRPSALGCMVKLEREGAAAVVVEGGMAPDSEAVFEGGQKRISKRKKIKQVSSDCRNESQQNESNQTIVNRCNFSLLMGLTSRTNLTLPLLAKMDPSSDTLRK
jgi:hypothetical protein